MKRVIRIGTRESELAIWQADLVKTYLSEIGYAATLVPVSSQGDLDQVTPLYEMGVQGIFTKSLDAALLNQRIDIAVHSMKDVPTALPAGISQAAVLQRGNHSDLFVINHSRGGNDGELHVRFQESLAVAETIFFEEDIADDLVVATSSVRRRAQWLHRYPKHNLVNLRGNMNTRMLKISESNWNGAILAAAGLERINLRPASAIELPWMLPAPSQGAIMLVCNTNDSDMLEICNKLNHSETALCTKIEKDFLRALMGGCSTPIGALAVIDKSDIYFKGNLLSTNGKEKVEVEKYINIKDSADLGSLMAAEILRNGGREIAEKFKDGE